MNYAHDEATIDRTVQVVADALGVYRRALDDGIDAHLVGPSVKPVYRRFN